MPTSRGAGVAKKGYDYAIYAEGGEVDREPKRAAFAKEMLPTRKPKRRSRPMPPPPRPSDTDVMRTMVSDMQREERVRKAEMPSDLYAKGGKVAKYASGGSCRGMGAATRGGNYKIK